MLEDAFALTEVMNRRLYPLVTVLLQPDPGDEAESLVAMGVSPPIDSDGVTREVDAALWAGAGLAAGLVRMAAEMEGADPLELWQAIQMARAVVDGGA